MAWHGMAWHGRKGHSTTTCIMSFLNDIYLNIDRKLLSGVVFLDLKKAFDTVDHDILLKKLSMYGLDENTIAWFESYLKNRAQRTKVNGHLSNLRYMSYGVPQGSILGPLLFIIYINDLSKYLTETKCSLYADDTAVYCNGTSIVDIVLSLRIDMSYINEWLRANKLTLNVKKTKYMIIGNKAAVNRVGDQLVQIAGETIDRVKEFKYLGLWLDETLTFDCHVNKVYNKVCQKLGAIRKVRNCLGKDLALHLYRSLVLPHYDYCDTIYMCANKDTLGKLQLVQNIGCRTILLADKRRHIADMHKELKLMPLSDRRDLHLSLLCHKNINPEGIESLTKYFKPAVIIG